MSKINKLMDTMQETLEEIKTEMLSFVAGLRNEENPDITPISSDGKFFSVKMSTIAKNNMIMSPFYYDKKEQAAFISQIIENSTPEKALKVLRSIADKGTVRHRYNTYVFHPDVRKKIRDYLD